MTDKHADIHDSLAKITPGKWETDGIEVHDMEHTIADVKYPDDAEFIANSPSYVRRLLDEVERAPKLWTCGDCMFGFDAIHENAGGGYSCPHCAELRLREENDRLQKALEFYANKFNYPPPSSDSGYISPAVKDRGEIARKALEGME